MEFFPQAFHASRTREGGVNTVKEKIPEREQEKPEPQARDKAASIIGNTNARYVQDAKKIEREAHVMVYNELQTEEFINESTNQYAD